MADLWGGIGTPSRMFKDLGGGSWAEVIAVAEDYPWNATPISNSSGNVVAAVASATLAAAAKYTYITGFSVTGAGAVAALSPLVTVTGCAGGTLTYVFSVPVGALVGAQPMNIVFPKPLKSSAVNTAIVVSVPSFGTGNLNSAVVAYGYQQ